MAHGEGSGEDKVVPGPWPPITASSPGGPSDGDPYSPGIDLAARMGRLEAVVEGLRHSQNLTIGATAMVGGILAAIIVGFGVYGLQRIDQTQESISREADATRQELVGVTSAIANSITAAREMRPPIIVIPTPGPHSDSNPTQNPSGK